MGYTTYFNGAVSITPPLNEAERTYLREFAETRRMDHVCNGIIEAQGEDPDDKWRLVVEDNNVRTQAAKIVWED